MYQPLLTRKDSQESKKKMFRMNTRVLLEHVIYAELLLLIVITWPVLEFAINKIEFRYDLVFIPCTVFASYDFHAVDQGLHQSMRQK